MPGHEKPRSIETLVTFRPPPRWGARRRPRLQPGRSGGHRAARVASGTVSPADGESGVLANGFRIAGKSVLPSFPWSVEIACPLAFPCGAFVTPHGMDEGDQAIDCAAPYPEHGSTAARTRSRHMAANVIEDAPTNIALLFNRARSLRPSPAIPATAGFANGWSRCPEEEYSPCEKKIPRSRASCRAKPGDEGEGAPSCQRTPAPASASGDHLMSGCASPNLVP